MKRNKKKYAKRRYSRLVIGLCCVAIVLLILVIAMMLIAVKMKWNKSDVEIPSETPLTENNIVVLETTMATAEMEETTTSTAETTIVETGPREILEELAGDYASNPDLAGWITIDGTKIDYPVMYTPDDGEKYLRKDFKGNFSVGGLPFIEDGCSLDPESDNLIIYGHNMANGTMFNNIMNYQQKNFWEAHKTFTFKTLYEERTYEVISAFYDRVYLKTDTNFKFYQFIDARDEAHFNEAITYYKEHDLYETDVTAKYGDDLITLVTCAYHVDNGRFVVVARRVADSQS